MEGRFDTIRIRKFEAEKFRKDGFGYLIICGHGTYKHPLLTETKQSLRLLEKYRRDVIKK